MLLNSIVIKDPHFKFGFRVAYRYSFEQDIIDKLNQLKEYAEENQVDTIIIPGDVFDESYENKWSFTHYFENVKILQPFFSNFKNVLTIPGNHDYFNGFESPIKRDSEGKIEKTTIYGEFVRQGIIEDLSFPDYTVINDGVAVTGVAYSSDLDKVRNTLKEINSRLKDKITVVMLHQNVTPKPVKNITEFSYSELAKDYPNINVFCLGHYHIGYDTTRLGNAVFINPWNLTRVSRDYEVKIDKHIPSFTHLMIHDNGIIETKDIKLNVKSFDEAFKPEYKSVLELISKKENVDLNIDQAIIDSNISDTDIIKKVLNENIKDETRKIEVLNTIKDYLEHL